jgi:GNAT superfamily N-acetyltransferase
MNSIVIREGKKQDLLHVLELIKELAAFERASHEVSNTVKQMEIDGFGENPIYGIFVAEEDLNIIGISIYYYRYSTWKGKRLYLEDIVVAEEKRGRGVGAMLFDRTMQKSLTDHCTGMMWQVLEWNETGINFYKKYGAKLDAEWTNCSLEADQIRRLVKGYPIPLLPTKY